MTAIGVIPARYAAVRFPGKPLALLGGKPIVRHVHERAARAGLDRLLVATDDLRIKSACEEFGAEVVMTSPDAASGTDRIIEAIGHWDYDIIVNIQGDEPFVDADGISECVAALREDATLDAATLAEPIRSPDQITDPNVVKVVDDFKHNALYFSRAPIPYPRGFERPDGSLDVEKAFSRRIFLKHNGLYVYRKEALMRFASTTPSPLEEFEKLEQLRFLQSGGRMRIIEVEGPSVAIDTPADLARAEAMLS